MVQIGTDSDWQAVAGGNGHTCAIKDDALYCWGRHHEGELGLSLDLTGVDGCFDDNHSTPFWDCATPQLVDDSNLWTQIAGGVYHACGLDSTNTLRCWGDNILSELGHSGDHTPTVVP